MMAPPIVLTDSATGSRAKILPGYGFNCYSFEVVRGGQRREVLWSAPRFEDGTERPSHSGIPILFPFPGRIRKTSFTFEGKTYNVQGLDEGRGNAIHGFVLNRPWRVLEQTATRAVAQFHASKADPAILQWWPADFILTVSYDLAGHGLSSVISVENPSDRNLPFGLGTHAYFRLPLVEGSDKDACRVTVPASEYWELADMLPTGMRLPVNGDRELRSGKPFGKTNFDDILSGLAFEGGKCVARIDDPAGRTLRVTFGQEFRECVVYNPPHREAICIEPYTCVPDPFTLVERGIDAGLRVLPPGGKFQARVDIHVD